MANCQVKFDNRGNIQTVYDKAGNESRLFLSIAKLPMVKSMEEALEIYKQTYAQGIADSAEIVLTPGFESNIQRALKNIKDKNVKNVKGWINQLTDVQKTGVRYVNQEIEWIGLEDYLKDWVKENKPKNGNIPFDVVDQYVKDNQIEVVDVVKGKIDPKEVFGVDFSEMTEEEREVAQFDIGHGATTQTKYSQYTLQGGENYREVLFTLPARKLRIEEVVVGKDEYTVRDSETVEGRKEVVHKGHILDEIDPLDGESPKSNYTYYTNEQGGFSQSKGELEANQEDYSQENYRSSHWDEVNVLAHLRLNERTLPNGERVLFIEEVQADIAKDTKDTQDKFLKEINKSFDNVLDQLIKEGVIEEEC